jgi:hypothetical protein
MKQYVVDQLAPDDCQKLRSHFEENFGKPAFESIFWLPIDRFALSEIQQKHTDCQPYFVAVDLQPGQLVCELLVRTKNKMRCDCMGYATELQRNGIIDLIDSLLDELGIRV